MDRYDAIRIFVRVVESGSFSAAAKEAGMGQSAVSKLVASLEAWLGTQLLNRSSRGLSLTESGRRFYEGGLRINDEFSALETEVRQGQAEASGLLRLAVAPAFSAIYIVPHLPVFFASFPAIRIELIASDRHVNLVEDNIDLAIRHGELRDSSLTMRPLANSPLITVASPAYLAEHGCPTHPAELPHHACVGFTGGGETHAWRFALPDGLAITHRPEGRFCTNDGEQLRAAVLANMGITQVPAWLVGPELRSGALQPILRDFETRAVAINALHLSKRRANAKIRVFLDFLSTTLARDLPVLPDSKKHPAPR